MWHVAAAGCRGLVVSLEFVCAHVRTAPAITGRRSLCGRARRRTCVRMLVARWCSCLRQRRSCRAAQRAAAPAAWWASYERASLCGPLVASRPLGDFKTATNPHHIPIRPTPSDLGCVGPSLKKRAWKVNFKKTSSACFTPSHGGTAVRRSSALGDFGTTRATRSCAAPGNSPGVVWCLVRSRTSYPDGSQRMSTYLELCWATSHTPISHYH